MNAFNPYLFITYNNTKLNIKKYKESESMLYHATNHVIPLTNNKTGMRILINYSKQVIITSVPDSAYNIG
jgi:hypothetical protein